MRLMGLAVAGCVTVLGVSGCGFVHAGRASHAKPNGFVLRGYVTVAGAADTGPAGTGRAGTPCQAPPGAADIRFDTPVRVTGEDGHPLAAGRLGAGVLAFDSSSARCNFPFAIEAVPGGQTTYVVTVGTRPPVSFLARDLREDMPAVITVPATTSS